MTATDAPAVLLLDAAGGAVLQLTGADGEVRDYAVEPCPPGLDDWAVVLRRLDGQAGPYRVALSPAGAWRCSCADSIYRSRKERRPCKHAAAASAVRTLTRSLTP